MELDSVFPALARIVAQREKDSAGIHFDGTFEFVARRVHYGVCFSCGRHEWLMSEKPEKEGGPPAGVSIDGWKTCRSCEDFAGRFPDVYEWITRALLWQAELQGLDRVEAAR